MSASLILNPNSRQVGSMLGYKPVPQETNPNAVLPVEVSFTRNSVGMEKRSDGLWHQVPVNMPRRYWDGTEYSWLFEPQDTNSLLYSTDFSNAAWAAIGTATKNPSALPTNIKDVVPYDIAGLGVAGVNFFYQSLGNNTDVYYKVFIRATVVGDVGKTIRLTSNAALSVSITLTEAWQEYSVFASGSGNNQLMLSTGVTGTPATACTISYCGIHTTNSTSPIITSGSAVTRLADNPSGTMVAATTGYTIAFEFDADENVYPMDLSNGSGRQGIFLIASNKLRFTPYLNGTGLANMVPSGSLISGFNKGAVTFNGSTYKLFVNGVLEATLAAVGGYPTAYVLRQDFGPPNGTLLLKPMEYYLTALSDTEAIELTTI